MNPGAFVMGGGGAGGGGSGRGGRGGKGNGPGDGEGGGDSAGEGGAGAGACGQGSGGGCPNPAHGGSGTTAGDPVDIATGRVFTTLAYDLVLPGPLRLVITRQYSSTASERDIGLGFGWSHSLAWEIEERRRVLILTRGDGTRETLPRPEPGKLIAISPARSIACEKGFYVLRDEADNNRYFRQLAKGRRYVLFRIQNRWDHRIELEYDSYGRLESITDSVFRVVRVRRHADGRIAAFEVRNGPPGAAHVGFYGYRYDSAGDLVEVTDIEGNVTRYGYGEHLLTRVEYADGLVVRHRYDRQMRCVETWAEYRDGKDPSLDESVPALLADGRTPAKGVLHCIIDYADDYVEVTDSRQLRRYFLNEHKKLDKGCWGSAVWTQTYDQFGNLTSSTDPRQAMTVWTRDELGRVVAAQDPVGSTTTLDYDDTNSLSAITDALGSTTHYECDERGALLHVWDDLGDVVRYERDGLGNVVEATMPNGGITRMSYDEHCNRIEIVEPNGGVRKIRYDYLGQVLSHVDPEGGETRYEYYPSGRVRSVTYPNGGVDTWAYDALGRIRRIQDANGRVFDLRWGGYDVVHEVVRSNGNSVKFRYDREGGILRIINEAGETYRYERDGQGRIIAEHTFDGRSYRYAHDECGNIVQVQNGALETWLYEYDACNRLVRREHPDGTIDEWERDPLGRVVVARHGAVECRRDYDMRGVMTHETVTVEGETTSIDFENDLLGKPARVQTSLGFIEEVERDPMGMPSCIRFDEGPEIRLRYDRCASEVARVLPDGGVIFSSADALGMLAHRRVVTAGAGADGREPDWVGPVPPGTVWQQSFSYTPGGELTAEHDHQRGTTQYEHDALGQLARVLPPAGLPLLFAYDETGNRISTQQERYAPGGRLLQRGSEEFRYNEEGALVERRDTTTGKVWRYGWSGAGMLTSLNTPDGVKLTFTYDAYARRVLKRVARPDGRVIEHRYVWAGDDLLHEIRRSANDAGDPIVEERTYISGPGDAVPLAQRIDKRVGDELHQGRWTFAVVGARWVPEAMVSGRGELLSEIDIDAWGNVAEGARELTPCRFAGQYQDAETGLHYNRYRYYDPELGRYISADPIRIQGSLRAYGYVENRPDVAYDAFGLQTTTIRRRDGTTKSAGPGGAPIHPAVDRALSPCTARPGGAGKFQPATNANPQEQGGRRPEACGEPAALSEHLRDWEGRNCPPNGDRSTCDPDTEEGRKSLASALDEIDPRGGIATRDANGDSMAPCPNCSQTIPSLWALSGPPDADPPPRPPPRVIAPGYRPGTAAAQRKRNQAAQPNRPPRPPERFMPPDNSNPSYDERIRRHNNRTGENRVVHTYDPETQTWGSYRPE